MFSTVNIFGVKFFLLLHFLLNGFSLHSMEAFPTHAGNWTNAYTQVHTCSGHLYMSPHMPMYVQTCICMDICMCTHTWSHVCAYPLICRHTHMHIWLHSFMHTYLHTCAPPHLHSLILKCTCVQIHMHTDTHHDYAHICTHVHTCKFMFACLCTLTHLHSYALVCTYTCTQIPMTTHTYAFMYSHVHPCLYTKSHALKHTHTHVNVYKSYNIFTIACIAL